MRINNITAINGFSKNNKTNKANPNFGHKILIDIGASNPRGSCKVTVKSENGKILHSESGFLNDTTKGFKISKNERTGKKDGGQKDFINKLDAVIRKAYATVQEKVASGEAEFAPKEKGSNVDDKKLTGVAVFVPGTTYCDKREEKIAFIPNLKNTKGESLTDIDLKKYEEDFTLPVSGIAAFEGIKLDKNFSLEVTKDLGGAGLALAKILAQKGQMRAGNYIMGIMTGGGFGSVDIKVKGDDDNPIVEFETSESSSYLTGNTLVHDKINNTFKEIVESEDPVEKFNKLKEEVGLPEAFPVLEKLGRQGVSVKSHLKCFFNALELPIERKEVDNLVALAQKVGDARLVSNDIMYLSKDDTELYDEVSECKFFKEVESDNEEKYAFSLNHDLIDDEKIKKARIHTVNDYANSVSLISINKINDCINKVYLVGPFAQGLNKHIQENPDDYGVKDLPSLIEQKILTNTDAKHADLPSTRRLMKLYDFEVICDPEINFPDNTFAGEYMLDDGLQFTPRRGSWFQIPLATLVKDRS